MAQHFYCFTEILLQVTRLFSVAENYKRLQGGGGDWTIVLEIYPDMMQNFLK